MSKSDPLTDVNKKKTCIPKTDQWDSCHHLQYVKARVISWSKVTMDDCSFTLQADICCLSSWRGSTQPKIPASLVTSEAWPQRPWPHYVWKLWRTQPHSRRRLGITWPHKGQRGSCRMWPPNVRFRKDKYELRQKQKNSRVVTSLHVDHSQT